MRRAQRHGMRGCRFGLARRRGAIRWRFRSFFLAARRISCLAKISTSSGDKMSCPPSSSPAAINNTSKHVRSSATDKQVSAAVAAAAVAAQHNQSGHESLYRVQRPSCQEHRQCPRRRGACSSQAPNAWACSSQAPNAWTEGRSRSAPAKLQASAAARTRMDCRGLHLPPAPCTGSGPQLRPRGAAASCRL